MSSNAIKPEFLLIVPVQAERGEIRLHDAFERAEGRAGKSPVVHLFGGIFPAVVKLGYSF